MVSCLIIVYSGIKINSVWKIFRIIQNTDIAFHLGTTTRSLDSLFLLLFHFSFRPLLAFLLFLYFFLLCFVLSSLLDYHLQESSILSWQVILGCIWILRGVWFPNGVWLLLVHFLGGWFGWTACHRVLDGIKFLYRNVCNRHIFLDINLDRIGIICGWCYFHWYFSFDDEFYIAFDF